MRRERRPVPTVVSAAVALSLLYIGFIRVFEPDTNHRILVIGVCLIAVAAAVCLNAFTLGTVTERPAIRGEPSCQCSTQGKSTSDIPDSGPDNFKERQ